LTKVFVFHGIIIDIRVIWGGSKSKSIMITLGDFFL